MPETCRVFFDQIKFGKFVLLVGFIIKKFVTMHGHMNVKFFYVILRNVIPVVRVKLIYVESSQ